MNQSITTKGTTGGTPVYITVTDSMHCRACGQPLALRLFDVPGRVAPFQHWYCPQCAPVPDDDDTQSPESTLAGH